MSIPIKPKQPTVDVSGTKKGARTYWLPGVPGIMLEAALAGFVTHITIGLSKP